MLSTLLTAIACLTIMQYKSSFADCFSPDPYIKTKFKMSDEYFENNWVHMFIAELTSRIVAKSGIPSDRFHLGKIILQCLKDDPEFVMQIDGATGESETNGSVLRRSIKCATFLSSLKLKKGDVMVLMAPNHLDLTIPFYAGWYLGLALAPTDKTMNIHDLQQAFKVTRPKVVFCQSEKVMDVQKVVKLLDLDTKIISFDKSSDAVSLSDMLETSGDDVNVEDFKATELDPEETISLLIATSGTTGLPKAAALTHKSMVIGAPYVWCFSKKFPSPTRSVLLVAPLQWLSTLISFVLSPILKYLRIQSSALMTPYDTIELIKKYKPTYMITSPTMLSTLRKVAEEQDCDFSNFEFLFAGGSAVPTELLNQIKGITPNTIVKEMYALSELGTLVFQPIGAPGSSGKRNGHFQYRLVDVATKEDIREPNKPGELWLKGPGMFKGYYNNPKATEDAFAEGRWFMTGDLLYRDENWNYYFVERLKSLLKFKNHQIAPAELEAVIHQHPAVLDVAVTGVPDPDCGDLAVACVVLRPGFDATADEIKNLVKEKLSDSKRLRGGVIFLNELPLTASTKVNRRKVKEIAMERISELDLQRVIKESVRCDSVTCYFDANQELPDPMSGNSRQ